MTYLPHPSDPSTILLGVYVEAETAGIVGSLRDECRQIRPDVLAVHGPQWAALAQALREVPMIGAEGLVILTNSAALVTALSRPFKAPDGDATKRIKIARGKYRLSGDVDHWAVLQQLGMLGGDWAIYPVAEQVLQKAKAQWQLQS